MNEQKKRQLIKALAYDTDREQIKSVMNVSDEDINSISVTEIESEKKYYKEMGYIK
ncbi:hypothetical protein [Ruminococcus intestinalis]|uniref:hypothetical protein n=1 Tax=Ruminococcus intestinalis TaxID=2763066 RepID=UPI0025D49EF5|nr:hypothetical protein [uncultured Ruminococcus sp.]